jgi:hypothetical protein
MATVRGGVKRIGAGTGYEVSALGEPGQEVQQHWVELNGLRLDGGSLGLLRVDYVPAPPGESPGQHCAEVVIRIACEGFATEDYRAPETDGRGVPLGTELARADAANAARDGD